MRGQGHKDTTNDNFLFIYIHLRYEYHWKAAEKNFSMKLTSLKLNKKIKPGGPLLLNQGRSSGDFVSNFQPSYIKNYSI